MKMHAANMPYTFAENGAIREVFEKEQEQTASDEEAVALASNPVTDHVKNVASKADR
jgi:hypothetical protein